MCGRGGLEDRYSDSADGQDGQVVQQPLVAGAGHQCHPLTGADSRSEQTRGKGFNITGEPQARDRQPLRADTSAHGDAIGERAGVLVDILDEETLRTWFVRGRCGGLRRRDHGWAQYSMRRCSTRPVTPGAAQATCSAWRRSPQEPTVPVKVTVPAPSVVTAMFFPSDCALRTNAAQMAVLMAGASAEGRTVISFRTPLTPLR